MRFIIESSTDCLAPATTVASKDDPYSTNRCSPRWYQCRLGMRVSSGPPPMAIDERQTGVSDGKAETPSPVTERSRRSFRVGAASAAIAASSAAGARPSMTIRTSLGRGT